VNESEFTMFELERVLNHSMDDYKKADELADYLFYLSGSDQSPAKVCGP
jgi:hypothetical protein